MKTNPLRYVLDQFKKPEQEAPKPKRKARKRKVKA